MATADEKPTIVMIQGSFQTPLFYKALLDRLVSAGYPTRHPPLPSCTNPDSPNFPLTTLIDDALEVRRELTRLIEYDGKTVVVVMHSYGGLVGSEAIPEELNYSTRQARGLSGGVIHLFFFTAFLLPEGQSVMGTFGESPNNDVGPDGRFIIRDAERILFNDLSPSEASLWASRLIPQSYVVQLTKLTRAAYRYIPSTYLICENDQAVPIQYQEGFAASGNSKVKRCSAGHSPMLSQPDMLTKNIVKAAEDAMDEATCKGR